MCYNVELYCSLVSVKGKPKYILIWKKEKNRWQRSLLTLCAVPIVICYATIMSLLLNPEKKCKNDIK